MRPNRIILSAIATATVLPIAACGGVTVQTTKTTTTVKPSSSATTTTAVEPSGTVATTTVAAAFPESCTATPAGAFGLTGVEVTPAAGHPDGAKTVRWTTNSPIPAAGTVAFTLKSGSVLRGVKFDAGQVVGNYVFHMKAANQDNITIPPGIDGDTVSVFIPAAAAGELGTSWTADLEVDGHSTGKCVP